MATTTSATPTTTSSGFNIPSSSADPIHLSRDAIIWLAILGICAVAGISTALYFLLRYSCSKASRKRGQRVDDERNEHKQWWKHAHAPVDGGGDGSSVEFAALTRDVEGMGGSWPMGGFGVGREGRSEGVKSRYFSSGQQDVRVEKMVV